MKPLLLALALGGTSLHAEPIAQDALADMAAADIVILGEVHDNPLHHQGQAVIIAALDPSAVVFEMLSPEQAATVNEGGFEDVDALAEAIAWADSGWPDFAIYVPVFEALGETPVAGAAMPSEEIRRAFGESAGSVFGAEAAAYGLDQPVPEAQLALRMTLQFDAHCQAVPIEMMGGMVEAQRLRDAHFARVALEALKNHGAPVIVIAGNGHARLDWGMPSYIAQAAPDTAVKVVGFVEEPATDDNPRFDLTIPTAPLARPDPCDTFKKD